jgi:hypothetical protein
MITKEEENKFINWVMSASSPIDERSEDYYHRGFVECGMIEREPTAKEKLYKYLSEHVIMDITNHTGYVSFEIRSLIYAAIREAEEKNK